MISDKEEKHKEIEITAYRRNIRRVLRQRDNNELETPLRKMRIGRSFQAKVFGKLLSKRSHFISRQGSGRQTKEGKAGANLEKRRPRGPLVYFSLLYCQS